MKIEIKDIAGILSQSRRVNDKARDIYKAAVAANLQGEELGSTLITSGVALGVEETQHFYGTMVLEHMAELRGYLEHLDRIVPMCTEEDASAEVGILRTKVKKALKDRSDTQISNVTQAFLDNYGVPPELVTGSADPEDLPMSVLERIGLVAYDRDSVGLSVWAVASKKEDFKTMRCRCSACVIGICSAEELRDTKITDILEDYPDSSAMFSEYGGFLLGACRGVIDHLIQGVELHDNSTSARDPAEVMKNILSSVRRK